MKNQDNKASRETIDRSDGVSERPLKGKKAIKKVTEKLIEELSDEEKAAINIERSSQRKVGRKFGTDKQWTEDNKTIRNQKSTQKWANKLMPKTLVILEKTLTNPATSPVVVKGICELIHKITKEFYDKIEVAPDGRAVNKVTAKKTLKEEVADEARRARDVAEQLGGGNGLISLVYEEESSDSNVIPKNDRTGTES